jgi:3-deoxy-7-phosphoheptulonate synthase / chorismate mutase
MRGQRKVARPVPVATVEPAAPVLSAAAALDLACLREELDTINQELLALLERRGRIVHQVMQIKREYALPAHDPQRERRMVEALLSAASDVYPRAALERVFATIFEISRDLFRSPTAK